MPRRRRTARLWLLVLLPCACTARGIEWDAYLSLRATGANLDLAHVDTRELEAGKVRRNLDYASIALDHVFFRNLPDTHGETHVVVGLEIDGILPKGRSLKTVPEIRRIKGPDSLIFVNNAVFIEPFLYTGQNVTFTLHFRAVRARDAAEIRGRLGGAGGALQRLNPHRADMLDTSAAVFASIFGASGGARWSYRFTLYPSDGMIPDKPEALFTAARHILLATAPASAPDVLRTTKPSQLMRALRMRGSRLVWMDTETEYTLTPYIVLNVTRYRRYPNTQTELRKLIAELTAHYEQGSLELARNLLPAIGAAIARDPVITTSEKNLEREWRDVWQMRIDARVAGLRGDRPGERKQVVTQIRNLLGIRDRFRNLLEAYEKKEIDHHLASLLRRAEDLAGEPAAASEVAVSRRAVEEALRRDAEATAKQHAEEKRTKRTEVALADRLPKELLERLPRDFSAGETPRFYKKWWFWTAVGAAVAGGAAAALLRRSQASDGFVVGR